MKKRKSILKHIYDGIADIFYNLSVMFGTNNWGKTTDELINEVNNEAWEKTGQDFRNACIKVANKYGYKNG